MDRTPTGPTGVVETRTDSQVHNAVPVQISHTRHRRTETVDVRERRNTGPATSQLDRPAGFDLRARRRGHCGHVVLNFAIRRRADGILRGRISAQPEPGVGLPDGPRWHDRERQRERAVGNPRSDNNLCPLCRIVEHAIRVVVNPPPKRGVRTCRVRRPQRDRRLRANGQLEVDLRIDDTVFVIRGKRVRPRNIVPGRVDVLRGIPFVVHEVSQKQPGDSRVAGTVVGQRCLVVEGSGSRAGIRSVAEVGQHDARFQQLEAASDPMTQSWPGTPPASRPHPALTQRSQPVDDLHAVVSAPVTLTITLAEARNPLASRPKQCVLSPVRPPSLRRAPKVLRPYYNAIIRGGSHYGFGKIFGVGRKTGTIGSFGGGGGQTPCPSEMGAAGSALGRSAGSR